MGYHVLGSEAGNYVIYCLLRIRPRPKNGEIKEGTVGKGGGGNVSSRHMIYQHFYFGRYSLSFRNNWVKSF